MSLTPNEYEQLNKKYSPSSPTWKNCLMAFLVGGLICTLGQVIVNISRSLGLPADEMCIRDSPIVVPSPKDI